MYADMRLTYTFYLYLYIFISVYSSIYIFSIFYFGRTKKNKKEKVKTEDLIVLIPVYNENENLFRQCINSVKKENAKFIVIGNGCNEPYRSIVVENGGKFMYLKENIGKKGALAYGIKYIKTKYVMFLDSDTILSKNAVIKLLGEFDEKTGGVGAEIKIIKERNKFIYYPSEMLQRLRQISFRAMSHFNKVLVLNGQCAVYRTGLIKPFVTSNEFLNRSFMGKKMIIGEDVAITKYVNLSGYKTKIAQDVIVRTKGQDSFKKLIKQAIRWSRSGYINFILSMKDFSLYKNGIFYAFSMLYVYTLPPLILLLLMMRGGLLADIIIKRGIINGGRSFIYSLIYTPRALESFIIPYIGIRIISLAALGIMLLLLIKNVNRNKLRFLSYGSIILLVMFLTSIYAIISINKHNKWLTR